MDHERLTIDLIKCECSWMITHSQSETFNARAIALRRRMERNVFMLEEYEANTKNDALPRPELVITNYDPQSDFWAWLRHYAGFTPQGYSKDEEAQFNDAFAKAREADDKWGQASTHADRMQNLERALERARAGDYGDWEEEGNVVLADAKKRR